MSSFNGKAIAVIGTNRTGKSTFAAKKLISPYKRRVLILIRDDREPLWFKVPEIGLNSLKTFTGIKKLIVGDARETMQAIFKDYDRGMLVIDDARTVTRSRDEDLRDIYQKRRQKELDIVFICHSLKEYPPNLWAFSTDVVLFRTQESFNRVKANIPNENTFETAMNYVNRKALKNNHFCFVFSFDNPPTFSTKKRRK